MRTSTRKERGEKSKAEKSWIGVVGEMLLYADVTELTAMAENELQRIVMESGRKCDQLMLSVVKR